MTKNAPFVTTDDHELLARPEVTAAAIATDEHLHSPRRRNRPATPRSPSATLLTTALDLSARRERPVALPITPEDERA